MIRKLLCLLSLSLAQPAAAQDAAASLALELNAVQPAGTACRVTFLATNGLGTQLDRAAVEVALFDADGVIDRIVTLDFKGLDQGKTKVLQFELADLACDRLGRVLVNNVTACEGTGLAESACINGLVTTAKPDIAFGV